MELFLHSSPFSSHRIFFSNLLVPSPPKKKRLNFEICAIFIKITINVQVLVWWKNMPISKVPPNYQPNKNYVFFTTMQGTSHNPTTSEIKLERLSTFLEVWESYLPLQAMHRSRDFLFNPKFRVKINCLDRLEYNQCTWRMIFLVALGTPKKQKMKKNGKEDRGFLVSYETPQKGT